MPIFTDFASAKASPVLIRISMIPGIIVVLYRLPLSMVARERISNGNNVHFILLSIPRANQSVKKIFLKVECYCFHKFCKTNSFQDGVKTWCKDVY